MAKLASLRWQAQARVADIETTRVQEQDKMRETIAKKDKAIAELEAKLEVQAEAISDEVARMTEDSQSRFNSLQAALTLQQQLGGALDFFDPVVTCALTFVVPTCTWTP